MNELEERVIGVFEAEDEALNAALGADKNIPLAGNPHATVSQRLGQMILYGTPSQVRFAKFCDFFLTWIENHIFHIPTKSHCLTAIQGFPKDLPKTG